MWEYAEAGRLMTLQSVRAATCIYCRLEMRHLQAQEFGAGSRRIFAQASLCKCCGWWTVFRVHQGEIPRSPEAESYSGTIGCLKELDLSDASVPLNEVRQYLAARPEGVFAAHPRLFEEVVGSVFKDFGYSVTVTSYSGDEGIDVILRGASGDTIGVQVRRYKEDARIEAEQIRSLAGALVLGGHTKGIFVTTCSYRSGARETAERYGAIGYPIELVDAEQFLSALGIAQIRSLEVDGERIASYVMSSGAHIGSGLTGDFLPGEDLLCREPVVMTFTRGELIDMGGLPKRP